MVFGAGAIGATVGGWIAAHYDNIYFYDRGEVAEAMKSKGITLYQGDSRDKKETVKVKVIDDLGQALDADVVLLAVKNFSLQQAAKQVFEKLGDRPIIVSLANGLDNQKILPQYFSKVIYCVLCYNGWRDDAELVGYNKKGPLILGTLKNELQTELREIARIFNLGAETLVSQNIQDVVHCKVVINLANSTTTLAGFRYREISDWKLFQKILLNQMWEGVKTIRAAGYQECRLGGMPSWKVIWLGAKLPMVSNPLFIRNLKKTNLSSMGQDVLQRKSTDTELESLNGYIVQLAEKTGIKIPYNQTIYDICKREFARPGFQPWDVQKIWAEVKKAL